MLTGILSGIVFSSRFARSLVNRMPSRSLSISQHHPVLLRRLLCQHSRDDDSDCPALYTNGIKGAENSPAPNIRPEDFEQLRDLDVILTERASRFYDPALVGHIKEKCILVSVEVKLEARRMAHRKSVEFSHLESLNELSELVGTAGLQVVGNVIQKLNAQNTKTYIGSGKALEIMALVNQTEATVIVVDDDLNSKQQRNLEDLLISNGGQKLKVLDRTAIILEIFAQHAKSREGQLQVELAMLEYRMTRGPSSSGIFIYYEVLSSRSLGDAGRDSGAGFRGPGESKLETDRRIIKERIVQLKHSIRELRLQREHHRDSRKRLGLPVIALVGYTNAGDSEKCFASC